MKRNLERLGGDLSLLQVIEVVKVVKATQRKPEKYRRLTFFSRYDLWMYDAKIDNKLCLDCLENEATPYYFGTDLRSKWPHLRILDENTIGGEQPSGDGLEHPNCRCRLRRVTIWTPTVLEWYIEYAGFT